MTRLARTRAALLAAAAALALAAGGLVVVGVRGAAAQQPHTADSWPADSVAVRVSLARFLTAFENLDWPTFGDSFDAEATAFFPVPEPPERADGRDAVRQRFRKVFEEIRASAPNGPPYMRLEPEHLHVERLGPGLALVSFELHDAERVARRTFVLRQGAGGWKILHLHASNTPTH